MTLTVRRTERPLCSECVNGYLGAGGVFCVEYRELIDNERTAEECASFDLPRRVGDPVVVVGQVEPEEPE